MRRRPEPLDPATEALLAAERAFPPQAEERRSRALARARNLVADGKAPSRWSLHSSSRGRWLAAIGAGIVTAAAWAAVRHLREPRSLRTSPEPMRPSLEITPSAPEAPATPAIPSGTTSALPEARRFAPPRSSRPSSPSDGYDAELRLLEPARSAMARGNFRSALAALAEHQRRFPSGKLAEEREALRIKAMLGLGSSDEARAAAADFRKRFPTSVLLPRVEEMVQVAP